MKKIINSWKGLDVYMCFGCAPTNFILTDVKAEGK